MSRLIILGATGSLGSHVLRLAAASGHEVSAFVRTPSRLPSAIRSQVAVHEGDLSILAPGDLAQIVSEHDSLISCAGLVTEGQTFVDLVDRIITGIESMPADERPACWFLGGAALLDMDPSGRRGVDLPRVRSTYWPHRLNFERLCRSSLDWRMLCPGPMVEEPALGLDRLRVSLDRLPIRVPAFASALPGPLVLPLFAHVIPEMIIPYPDAASLMLANLDRDSVMTHHRVGLALPLGMRGKKTQWAATAKNPPDRQA